MNLKIIWKHPNQLGNISINKIVPVSIAMFPTSKCCFQVKSEILIGFKFIELFPGSKSDVNKFILVSKPILESSCQLDHISRLCFQVIFPWLKQFRSSKKSSKSLLDVRKRIEQIVNFFSKLRISSFKNVQE